MAGAQTVLGSLDHHEKGLVEVFDDSPKRYAFSNVFEVASKSKPYERVAVGRNLQYVIEVVRAEGNSPWYANAHDEAAIVMDGEVEVQLVKPDTTKVPDGKKGAVQLECEPKGRKMGWIKARRGHMALLPEGAAYQFRCSRPGVLLIQTIKGDCTVERWAQICQTETLK